MSLILSRTPNLVHGRPAVNQGSYTYGPLSACTSSSDESFLFPTFTGNLSLVQLEASTAQFQRPYLNLVRSQMLPHTFQNLQDIGIVAMNTQGFRVDPYLRT